jgi:hypothetical protein
MNTIFHQTANCQFTNYPTRGVHPQEMSIEAQLAALDSKRLAPVCDADK